MAVEQPIVLFIVAMLPLTEPKRFCSNLQEYLLNFRPAFYVSSCYNRTTRL